MNPVMTPTPKGFPKAQFGRKVDTNPTNSNAVLVTQEMIDEWEVSQTDFTIPQTPQGQVLKSAFSFTTKNTVPGNYDSGTNPSPISLNWNGVTRILITPTMGTIPTGGITSQTVNGFKATMSALTLYGITNDATLTGNPLTEFNPLVEYQGVSYTISVLTGQDLLDELKTTYIDGTNTSKIIADALVKKEGTNFVYQSEESLVLSQGTSNYLSQYTGTYAVQDKGSKTESIWESCVVGGTIDKYVKATLANAGEENATATFALSENSTITIQGTPTTASEIPILAMIRVDLPEDLISEVYTSPSSESGKIKLGVMNIAGQLAVEIGYGTGTA